MSSHDEIRAALEAASPGPWEAVKIFEDEMRVLAAGGHDLASGCYSTLSTEDARLISNSPTWLAELLAEVDTLTRWKFEALIVMQGLQELGSALGLPLGEHITGTAGVDAAQALHARAEAAEQENERLKSQVVKLRSRHHDGCVWCCANTPPLQRGERHKICSAP